MLQKSERKRGTQNLRERRMDIRKYFLCREYRNRRIGEWTRERNILLGHV